MSLIKNIFTSLFLLIILTAILGILYPLAMMEIGQLAFSNQANGSLIEKNGVIIGSKLISQNFSSDIYFHGRPSLSDSSNTPMSKAMLQRISDRIKTVQTYNLQPNTAVPINLITDSGSTFDPDISPEGACFQITRISKVTGIAPDKLTTLVDRNIKGRFMGIYGEKTVNVLLLNLDLNSLLNEKR